MVVRVLFTQAHKQYKAHKNIRTRISQYASFSAPWFRAVLKCNSKTLSSEHIRVRPKHSYRSEIGLSKIACTEVPVHQFEKLFAQEALLCIPSNLEDMKRCLPTARHPREMQHSPPCSVPEIIKQENTPTLTQPPPPSNVPSTSPMMHNVQLCDQRIIYSSPNAIFQSPMHPKMGNKSLPEPFLTHHAIHKVVTIPGNQPSK